MTDREMLELAAKAAGIKIDKSSCNGGGSRNIGFDVDGNAVLDWHNNKSWNPLTDDGDALRLAVKLRLEPRFIDNSRSNGAEPSRVTLHNVAGIVENIDDDPLAATRRAITRAAAEIGKGMK